MTAPLRALTRFTIALVLTLGVVSALPTTANAAPATGTITGTVRDANDGRPVKGVTITSRIRADVAQPTTTATSAADGTFSLKVPANTRVQVCGTASGRLPTCYVGPGYVIDRTPPSQPQAGVGTEVTVKEGATRATTDFELPVPARIKGLLTDTTGRPVAGVQVQARTGSGDDRATATSNSAGQYQLVLTGQRQSPASYCLDVATAADDGYAEARPYRTYGSDGVAYECTRQVSAGAVLTANVTLTADGSDAVRNITTPYFVGTPKVGYTLSARPGRWSPAPSLSYTWLDGARVIGTGPTLVVRPGQLGHAITIVATATAPGRAPGARSWTKPDRVVRGTLGVQARPRVTGGRKVGRTLKARPVTSRPGAKRTYRWLRNGKAIRGASRSTYRVTKADRRKRLSVRVSYSRAAYQKTTSTSRSTSRIR
jgi:hypothetical protein